MVRYRILRALRAWGEPPSRGVCEGTNIDSVPLAHGIRKGSNTSLAAHALDFRGSLESNEGQHSNQVEDKELVSESDYEFIEDEVDEGDAPSGPEKTVSLPES